MYRLRWILCHRCNWSMWKLFSTRIRIWRWWSSTNLTITFWINTIRIYAYTFRIHTIRIYAYSIRIHAIRIYTFRTYTIRINFIRTIFRIRRRWRNYGRGAISSWRNSKRRWCRRNIGKLTYIWKEWNWYELNNNHFNGKCFSCSNYYMRWLCYMLFCKQKQNWLNCLITK